jgi:ABC-2 type transport system ATP-binding protein
MAQKVQFITTVMHEPEFLILDEPFTGFDPINAELVKNELLALKDKGATIVLSTHRMESVETLCNYIALINNAHVILEGSVKEIRKTFRSNVFEISYHGNRIGFTNALWTGFELLELNEDPEVNVAHVRMLNGHTPNQLLKAILPHVEILGIKEIVPDMNTIFIQQVNQSKQKSA